jgi:hypothetical protein
MGSVMIVNNHAVRLFVGKEIKLLAFLPLKALRLLCGGCFKIKNSAFYMIVTTSSFCFFKQN